VTQHLSEENIETVIAYVATFALVLFGLTQMPNILTGLLLAKAVGLHFSQFVGALISWTIISAMWLRFTHQMIPILALVGSVALISYHFKLDAARLTEAAKSGMFTEVWAIFVIGVWRIAEAPNIRWL